MYHRVHKNSVLTLFLPKAFQLLAKIKTRVFLGFFFFVHNHDTLECSESISQRASCIIKRQFAGFPSHLGMRPPHFWAQTLDRWQDLQFIQDKVLAGKADSQNFRY